VEKSCNGIKAKILLQQSTKRGTKYPGKTVSRSGNTPAFAICEGWSINFGERFKFFIYMPIIQYISHNYNFYWYLDLGNPKVQKLLTSPEQLSEDKDFSRINLQGAYLQEAILHEFKFIETNLNGADLKNADLFKSILVGAQVKGADFTGANLTGICIEDWSVNSQTCFSGVTCKYIYRKYENDKASDKYPNGRDFEPGEFEAIFQKLGNVVELIFKEQFNGTAFHLTMEKLKLEDDSLGLELQGFEKRGNLGVVKVSHNENIPSREVEQRFYQGYEEINWQLQALKEQNKQLLDILTNQVQIQVRVMDNQATAIERYSRQPSGSSFFIMGSTITNLAGSGQIDYNEASNKIRSLVASGGDPTQITTTIQSLLNQFQQQSSATTSEEQAELIQQVILQEAGKDEAFKQSFIQQSQQIMAAIPEGAIASAIRNAIAHLSSLN
jgi:Pentapeptide repeats (8 copies)